MSEYTDRIQDEIQASDERKARVQLFIEDDPFRAVDIFLKNKGIEMCLISHLLNLAGKAQLQKLYNFLGEYFEEEICDAVADSGRWK